MGLWMLWLYVGLARRTREEAANVGAKGVLAVFSQLTKHQPLPGAPCQGFLVLYPVCSDGEQAGLFTLHG